jgi:hypothetical protein
VRDHTGYVADLAGSLCAATGSIALLIASISKETAMKTHKTKQPSAAATWAERCDAHLARQRVAHEAANKLFAICMVPVLDEQGDPVMGPDGEPVTRPRRLEEYGSRGPFTIAAMHNAAKKMVAAQSAYIAETPPEIRAGVMAQVEEAMRRRDPWGYANRRHAEEMVAESWGDERDDVWIDDPVDDE